MKRLFVYAFALIAAVLAAGQANTLNNALGIAQVMPQEQTSLAAQTAGKPSAQTLSAENLRALSQQQAQSLSAQSKMQTLSAGVVYPEFTSTLNIAGGIENFAASENSFAFCQGKYIYVYSGGIKNAQSDGYIYEGGAMELSPSGELYAYAHNCDITDLKYLGEELTFKDETGAFYTYAENSAQSGAAEFEPTENAVQDGITYTIIDGKLCYTDFQTTGNLSDGVYSVVKKSANGEIFAIKDGELCIVEAESIDNISTAAVSFSYTDITHGDKIAVADAPEKLKELKNASYVQLAKGSYLTQVDLTDLSGGYFKVGKDGTFILSESANALLLYSSSGADIVAMNGKSYVTSHTAVTLDFETSTAPFTSGSLNYASGLYSAPFISEGTKIATLQAGSAVEIEYELKAESGILTNDFCKVTITGQDGAKTQGYVPTAFLTAFDFSGGDGDFETEKPEDYSEKNVIITVALVMLIVVLVLGGVAYLAYFSGSNKKRSGKSGNRRDENQDIKP